ncbi:uncharacterized protein LOC111877325 [Lactuca sativa]|uniref:uncharacterized protein LOC111877325 n=1 Tax=Lactuca sativa TaxID=4236 RepID=UPI000CC85CF7|nr:uncharacterized protein LOC111877325 [Lactuca sativa]
MEGEYGMYKKGSSGWSYMTGNEEFQETDVWSVWNQRNDFDSKSINSKGSSSSSFTSRTIPLSTAARMTPSTGTYNPCMESRIPQQQSTPVSVPDWSMIYGKSNRSSHNSPWLDYGGGDDGDGNVMPPHEWIAHKLARSQISSFSVCEGAGRTLKGRDLSRVRNAVLTKTGFLE